MDPSSTAAAVGIGSFLLDLWEKVRGSKKVEKVEKVYFGESDERKHFLNENKNAVFIEQLNGDIYLGDKEKIPENRKAEIVDAYGLNKEKRKIDIIESDFYDRVNKYKTEFGKFKEIEKYFEYLDSNILSVLKMASYAESLFTKKDKREAECVRADIGDQYGKWGRKLSNLYLSGYINGLFDYLSETYGELISDWGINKELKNFVDKSDYIYFISPRMVAKEVANSIKEKIDILIPYIAIHAAGKNIETSKEVMEEVRYFAIESDYKISEEKTEAPSGVALYYTYITRKNNI